MTDFHTHILPRTDDGSQSLEMSLAMLKLEAEQGIRRVVATPHFYPHRDSPERFLERRCRAEETLREAMADCPGLPELELGAEVAYFPGISESDRIARLTMGGGRYILLELPGGTWTDSVYRELENLWRKQGLIPIIAHVDRYVRPLATRGIPERLEELPVLVQANASFFLRGSTRRLALRMLRKGQIHLLGSDCHNMDSRKPNLGAAVQRIRNELGNRAVAQIGSYADDVWNTFSK